MRPAVIRLRRRAPGCGRAVLRFRLLRVVSRTAELFKNRTRRRRVGNGMWPEDLVAGHGPDRGRVLSTLIAGRRLSWPDRPQAAAVATVADGSGTGGFDAVVGRRVRGRAFCGDQSAHTCCPCFDEARRAVVVAGGPTGIWVDPRRFDAWALLMLASGRSRSGKCYAARFASIGRRCGGADPRRRVASSGGSTALRISARGMARPAPESDATRSGGRRLQRLRPGPGRPRQPCGGIFAQTVGPGEVCQPNRRPR